MNRIERYAAGRASSPDPAPALADLAPAASIRSRVGTRQPTYQVPTSPAPMTTPASSGDPSASELSAQAVSIMAMASTLARRGMPSPARWSRTSGPILGRPRTQRSKRGLDFAKHAAASTKNPVVGSPGTTTPMPPRTTASHPSVSQPTRRSTALPDQARDVVDQQDHQQGDDRQGHCRVRPPPAVVRGPEPPD